MNLFETYRLSGHDALEMTVHVILVALSALGVDQTNRWFVYMEQTFRALPLGRAGGTHFTVYPYSMWQSDARPPGLAVHAHSTY